jgi:hypothetical protein
LYRSTTRCEFLHFGDAIDAIVLGAEESDNNTELVSVWGAGHVVLPISHRANQ